MDKRLTASERRAELLSLIEKVGFFNVNGAEQARKYGISRSQINSDLKLIAKHTELTDLNTIKAELDSGHKRMLKNVHNLSLTSSDERVKVQASRAYAEISDKYARFLEAFNLKKQLESKVAVEVKWKD